MARVHVVAVITAKPGKAVKDAFLIMRTHRVRHLPVVDGNNHLVGIETRKWMVSRPGFWL